MKKERIYLFDNLKALLILLVVFAHLLEYFLKLPSAKTLYMIIYSFHIPLFAFCSGYFARFSPAHIRKNLLYPFLVFELLYLLFDSFFLNGTKAFSLTKPYWLMWYLFAIIVWEMLLPLLETKSTAKQLALVCFSVLLGLLAGFDKKIGYYMSLSRIIVYFPFFLGAYYIRKENLLPKLLAFCRSKICRILSCTAAVSVSAFLLLRQADYKAAWFYGSLPYNETGYNILVRSGCYLFACIWILFLFSFMPNRRFFFSGIGSATLYIYLLHGFIVLWLGKKSALFQSAAYPAATAFLLAVLIVFILSRKKIQRLLAPLIRLP